MTRRLLWPGRRGRTRMSSQDVEIELINEKFHLGIRESDDYHTIAGYILVNLEALPKQGDTFVSATWRLL